MLKVLILEDNDFDLVANSLGNLEIEVKILNTAEERYLKFDDIHPLLDRYDEGGGFDLLIIDLQLPDRDHNGLRQLRIWLNERGLNSRSLNFGIIAITNHTEAEARTALGQYPQYFGHSFLGLAPKDENLGMNLKRLISNSFITPPFVRGGEKYFNTRLLREQFPIFETMITLDNQNIPFHQIMAVQHCHDEKLRVYTQYENLRGSVFFNQRALSASDFFRSYCYDSATVENTRREYHVGVNEWEANRDTIAMHIEKDGRSRVMNTLNNNFPAFVSVGRYFAINPLFLESVNDVRPNLAEIAVALRHFHLNDHYRGEPEHRVDPENDIRGNINISRYQNATFYVPLYGRTLQGIRNIEHIRVINTYHDRLFLFHELTSEKWKNLLTQLKRYYSIR